jgi:hypothetical protein
MTDDFIVPVDPFSEYAMALESDDYPTTDFTQFGFRGRIDVPAFAEAFDEAMALVPTFSCHLRDERRGARYAPVWVRTREQPANRLVVEDCRHLVNGQFDPMEFSTRFHSRRTLRRIDLTREFPVTCYLVRVRDDQYLFSILYHHSVMDGRKAFRMLTAMFAGYHRRVTGQTPSWAASPGMTSLVRNADVQPPPFREFAREQLAEIFATRGVAHVATDQPRAVRGRYSFRAVVEDEAFLAALQARARASEATLNDVLFAVARQAITQWNGARGADARRLRFMLITSLAGRMPLSEHAGAGVSALNFLSHEDGPRTLDERIRFFRDRRVDQLARGIDVAYHRTMARMVTALRVLPLPARGRPIRRLAEQVPCTFYLSNVGVLWPKVVGGRPTARSAIARVGNFVVNDVHSSASIARNIGVGLTVRTHDGRFYLNFVVDRWRFTKDEAEAFARHYVRTLEAAA